MTEPQCPHEVIAAICPGCTCPCRGCDTFRADYAAAASDAPDDPTPVPPTHKEQA